MSAGNPKVGDLFRDLRSPVSRVFVVESVVLVWDLPEAYDHSENHAYVRNVAGDALRGYHSYIMMSRLGRWREYEFLGREQDG